MKNVVKISALLLLGVGVPAVSVFAGTATATFNVTASVGQTCTIASSVSDLSFDTIAPATAATAQTSLSITCSTGTAYQVGLSNGSNYNAGRYLKSGANSIGYGLYQTSDSSTPWGNAVPNLYQGTGSGTAQAVTVYGKTVIVASPVNGNYSDTITATVAW